MSKTTELAVCWLREDLEHGTPRGKRRGFVAESLWRMTLREAKVKGWAFRPYPDTHAEPVPLSDAVAEVARAHRAARGWAEPSDTLRLPALDEAVRRAEISDD